MSAAWETAPATVAVKEHPSRTLAEAREKLMEWEEAQRTIDALLLRDDVCAADKMSLSLERMTVRCCMLACVNVIASCEVEMQSMAKRFEEKWGWLL